MADFYLVKKEDLDDLADGVRRATKTSESLTLSEMIAALNNHTTGGVETCTVTLVQDGPIGADTLPVYYINGRGALCTIQFPTEKVFTVAKNSIVVLPSWSYMGGTIVSGNATQITTHEVVTVFVGGDTSIKYQG